MLSVQDKYNHVPLVKHYKFAEKPPGADVIEHPYSILKVSWHCHLSFLGDLSDYDAVFLKRQDKFAQCLSMAISHDHPHIPFNIYKDTVAEWDQWVQRQEGLYISKSAFCIAFWGRESLEKNVVSHLPKFKTLTKVDYEDIDQNESNILKILTTLDLPMHRKRDNEVLPIRRNWDKWANVINKEEVLSWAEELFPQEGYTIDQRYYTK
jgi:hypothetical protein